ncbi:hypothetical protein A4A49_11374 [Nicotiana attenuata]|uniref:Uncharacterized protein n=1 Tax=Nicotiana attenuata TaxID=49451 RepID=A0A314KP49_NICAT|nr:hypothetical protein A4A49_11374 [Nicotiana attenuata]
MLNKQILTWGKIAIQQGTHLPVSTEIRHNTDESRHTVVDETVSEFSSKYESDEFEEGIIYHKDIEDDMKSVNQLMKRHSSMPLHLKLLGLSKRKNVLSINKPIN